MQPVIKMKNFFYIITLLLGYNIAQSQIHELGVFGGGSNFIGDVGKTNYISPNEPAFGILYKWNKSPRFSWRASIIQAKISGNDLDSEVEGRQERGLQFKNTITEFSAGFEFDFFDFDLHQTGFIATPYLSSGLSYFLSDNLYVINKTYFNEDNKGKFAIPMIVGVKMKISDSFVLGVETGARYTFTDDIDGSLPKNNTLKQYAFGNTNSKDWYVFTGVTLTYTFGQKPCFCSEK